MTQSGLIAIAAAIAIAVSTMFPALAQGLSAKDIRSSLIVSLAMMEALTIYGLLIAFMLISKI